MAAINQVMVEVLHVVERAYQDVEQRGLDGTQTTSSPESTSTTTNPASATTTSTSGGNGPTSSPLLFFVALGFGVVFTNLWIIVGVKYCFRYNARNRQIRAGEEGEINLENMPTRPHRRRREKKLMTMDEVNERFPLTKYKSWVASRAREGLPTAGGVNAQPSRAGSVRNVDMTDEPSSPVGTKHSDDRPRTADNMVTISPATKNLGGTFGNEEKSMDEKETATNTAAEPTMETLKEVHTTASTVDKHATVEDDDEEDDHIHTAVPPELLTNPGDSCAICIDTLEDDDDIRGLTCGHAFHAGCLDPWLTSRRACCPLCKADYYTPKPRPERTPAEEAAENFQRRNGRMNMPQAPHSAWTGIRGSPRLMLPGRFMNPPMFPQSTYRVEGRDTRGGRRPRREPTATSEPTVPTGTGVTDTSSAAASSRWRPRIGNPFSAISMPRMPGRSRAPETAETTETTTANPTPSQLEAGVVR